MKVSDFVNASKIATSYNTGTDTIKIYEILDGNLMPKTKELQMIVIRVAFTLKLMKQNTSIDENGGYVINRISRDENNNLQT